MPEKIRVLECIRQGQIGGGESHLLSLVENLDKTVFEPVVLSFTDGPMITRLKDMGISTTVMHTTRPFDIFKWKTVKNFIREQNVALVHAHGTRANSNVLWGSHSLGLPVIYTIHGWSFHQDQNAIVKKVRIMGERYLTKRSDLNISVSSSNQQSGKDALGAFDSIVVNNGIDLKKFDPQKQFRNIRKELKISEDKTLVLFIARFTSHKQPLTLIKAFAEAVKVNPNLHLLMVGDGDEKATAVDLIDTHGLKDSVTLEGFRQDVPDVLASADIFVLPSLWEGLPIGLLEAMAMSKAIIASNVDGTSEIISHNQNGLLVDTSELISNLTAALIELGEDSALQKKFSIAARNTVTERFDASVMTRKIERLYHDVLPKR